MAQVKLSMKKHPFSFILFFNENNKYLLRDMIFFLSVVRLNLSNFFFQSSVPHKAFCVIFVSCGNRECDETLAFLSVALPRMQVT